MDLNSIPPVVLMCLGAVTGLLLGYLAGSHRSRREQRQLEHAMNQQSLELLEARADVALSAVQLDQSPRKGRVLTLALQRLAKANVQIDQLADTIKSQKQHHFVEQARLKMSVMNANEHSRTVTAIARHASTRLIHAENLLAAAATIPAAIPPPVSPIGADDLQAILGIDLASEQRLNEAGIHRLEQLANLSAVDAAEIDQTMNNDASGKTLEWIDSARQLVRPNHPQ
ncbi:MAG: hypothetical protein V3U76_13435 [Granulosicoccus sp.]